VSARERLAETLRNPGLVGLREDEAAELIDAFAHELAEQQWAYAEEEWTGSDARMILRRRVARHLAELIDPSAGPARLDEETGTDGDPDTRCGDPYRTEHHGVARCSRGLGHVGVHAGHADDGTTCQWPAE